MNSIPQMNPSRLGSSRKMKLSIFIALIMFVSLFVVLMFNAQLVNKSNGRESFVDSMIIVTYFSVLAALAGVTIGGQAWNDTVRSNNRQTKDGTQHLGGDSTASPAAPDPPANQPG